MDQNLFNEICLQQLTLSGVCEGETVAVLTRGGERGEYADAFLWAVGRLGAQGFHLRLPAPAGTGDNDPRRVLERRFGQPMVGRGRSNLVLPA